MSAREPYPIQQLKYDKSFHISVCKDKINKSRAETWVPHTTTIQAFSEKLSSPKITSETIDEYFSMPKDKQTKIKDVGSFVGGPLKGGDRHKENVVNKQLITMDYDTCPKNIKDIIIKNLNAYCFTLYSTHSSRPEHPCFRIILYPDRVLRNEEYEPVSRRVAEMIHMDACCPSSHTLNQPFFWPSNPKDITPVFYHNDAPFIKVDDLLESYGVLEDGSDGWKDVSRWPRSKDEKEIPEREAKKQQDPLEKKNIIGSFCRKFSIHEAIKTYLDDVYKKEAPDRYTYVNGSTSMGLATYDNKFAYSHHASDPAYGQSLNAFDLVRVHKFGYLDEGKRVDIKTHNMPSFKAMEELARCIDGVKADLIKNGLDIDADAFDTFEDNEDDSKADNKEKPHASDAWLGTLKTTDKGALRPYWFNLITILKNDKRINAKIKYNDFSNRVEKENGEDLTKEELFNMRTFIGDKYEINFNFNDVKQAVESQAFENRYHPIRDYIKSLQWDGVRRIETIFIDYLGSIDNAYVREIAMCWFAAAVYRVFEPGYKFDTAIVLAGPQGIGKTRFITTVGLTKWYGELNDFDPKIAMESLAGKWIVELPEMYATKKEVEKQKAFLSGCYTRTRLAWEPMAVDFKRQCVFMGSTNEQEFFKDNTGNRRWWPIDCSDKKVDIDKLEVNIDQIWAEAYQFYLKRRKIWLEDEILDMAKEAQEEKREADIWEGLIHGWLEEDCPIEDIRYSKEYDNNYFYDNASVKKEIRYKVCVPEIWKDCLEMKTDPKRADLRRIGNILSKNEYFEKKGVMRFGKRFKSQKGWKRVNWF